MRFRSLLVFFILVLFFVIYSSSVNKLWSESKLTWESGNVNFIFHQKDEKIVREISKNIDLDIENFQRKIGIYPEHKIRIVFAKNHKEYLNFIESFPRIFEFSQAFYTSGTNTIFIRNIDDISNINRLQIIVLHEYIHLFVDQYWKRFPLWFNEGMAVFFSEGVSWDKEFHFVKNYLLNRHLSLEEMIYSYPDIEGKYADHQMVWSNFYTISALAVRYLYSKEKEGFYSFWDLAEKKSQNAQLDLSDFNKLFLQSFNMTPKMFYLDFEDYLKKYVYSSAFIYAGSLFWLVIPFFLIIARLKKYIKEKRIEKQWEDDYKGANNSFDKI